MYKVLHILLNQSKFKMYENTISHYLFDIAESLYIMVW